MNCRSKYIGFLLPIFIFGLMGFVVRDAGAQARGWCEQKQIIRAAKIDDRLTMPDIAAEGDNVYIVYRQHNIKLVRSTDRGKTWSAPVDIGPNLRVTNAPTITVSGKKIVVVFPAVVDVQGFSAFQLFSSISNDGGLTFSKPVKITESNEDTFSPRFLTHENQCVLLWLETPLAQTLGGVSTVTRPDFTPESVEEVIAMKIKDGSLEDKMSRVRSSVYVRTFNFTADTYSAPNNVDVLRGQSVPYIFTIYGPLNNAIYITANQNTEIRIYESKDGGQKWSKIFKGQEYFDPRVMMDVQVVDGKKNAVWIDRTFGKLIPVKFIAGENTNQFTPLSPEQYVRYVPKLAYSDGVFHVAWEAGEEAVSWITYMRTDAIPPSSKVTSPSDPALKERSANFTWEGSDNISDPGRLVYAFSIDSGKTWSAPQAETKCTVNTPPDGEYIFKVRAEDVAGNIQDKLAEFAFNTFQSAPDTRITQAPPPSVVVNKRSVEVGFTGEDNTDTPDKLLFSTKTDDGEWTEFGKGQTYTFANLSNGQHVLRVRMKDSRGNIDPTPAESLVSVQVGLELILGASPAFSANGEHIVFDWKAVDDKGNPVKLNYFYRLNKGDVTELNNQETLELKDLEEGRQRVEIWGRDASGDETQKEAVQWLIDKTPPETTAGFTKQFSGKFPMISLGLTDPPLADGSTTTPPRKIQYKFDEGDWIDLEDVVSIWPVPNALSFYSWGYVIQIRAVDAAGNIDPSPATVDMRIWVRTNPYIFYSVVGVAAILVLFLLRLVLKALFSGRSSRRPVSKSTSASSASSSGFSFGEDNAKKDDIFSSSSFSLDDDDEKKKDDDIFS